MDSKESMSQAIQGGPMTPALNPQPAPTTVPSPTPEPLKPVTPEVANAKVQEEKEKPEVAHNIADLIEKQKQALKDSLESAPGDTVDNKPAVDHEREAVREVLIAVIQKLDSGIASSMYWRQWLGGELLGKVEKLLNE